MKKSHAFIGLDVHKETIAVAVAEAGRDGEIRFWGNYENSDTQISHIVKKLEAKFSNIEYCYEAGPCGYAVYRILSKLKQSCEVVAPSRIPKKPGDRVKNEHHDAMGLARLYRAGERVPDEVHEAMRDLVRARHAANRDLKMARQRVQSFLLKYQQTYTAKPWGDRHKIWMGDRQF
ncbi:MAG: transposase, partial [Gammaproteobacteria bacterium]|nr:transposase [Gammaproteobacteria bacterium]